MAPRRGPRVVQRETRGISAACRCSSHAQVDHQPGYYVAAMGTEAVRFLVLWMASWIHSRQLEVIDFLREENCVLREQLGGRRLRFTDDQRRRLAVKGRIVGRRRLGEFAGLVTPDTILRWYRELIARKLRWISAPPDRASYRYHRRGTAHRPRVGRGCILSHLLPVLVERPGRILVVVAIESVG